MALQVTTLLEIIRLSLELANKIHDDMPVEQRRQFWEDHAQWMAFWRGLIPKGEDAK